MSAKTEVLKLIASGVSRALTPAEKESLKMANTIAAKAYEKAAKSATGGIIHPEHPIAIRESLLGLQNPGLNQIDLPTGAALLKYPNIEDIKTNLANNSFNFDKAVVGNNKSGEGWYDTANLEAQKIGAKAGFRNEQKQKDIGAAILAITSPKNRWDNNLAAANRAAIGLKSGELQKFIEDFTNLGANSFQNARDAGLFIPPTAKQIFPAQIAKLSRLIDNQSGVGIMNSYDKGIKTDAFYGAIRLPASVRKQLIKIGVMDKNERILDPEYMINGVRLGDIATMPTIDKFEGAKLLGLSGMGYGLPLKTLNSPKGYKIFADAVQQAAQRAKTLGPDFQSRGWMGMHDIYPNQSVIGGAGLVQPSVEDSLKAFNATGSISPELSTILNNALMKGVGLFG